MEFNEKLQLLRKQKNLTQEELAEQLFVSRTAVSKWESGRGYPGIDSLKSIGRLFGVSVDELLSGEELLLLAEAETRESQGRLRDLLFGTLDFLAASLFFLPFFGQQAEGHVDHVSLLALTGLPDYIRIPYLVLVSLIAFGGILLFALQNVRQPLWVRVKLPASLALSILAVLFFIMSTQPYAAAFLFCLLLVKGFLLLRIR